MITCTFCGCNLGSIRENMPPALSWTWSLDYVEWEVYPSILHWSRIGPPSQIFQTSVFITTRSLPPQGTLSNSSHLPQPLLKNQSKRLLRTQKRIWSFPRPKPSRTHPRARSVSRILNVHASETHKSPFEAEFTPLGFNNLTPGVQFIWPGDWATFCYYCLVSMVTGPSEDRRFKKRGQI